MTTTTGQEVEMKKQDAGREMLTIPQVIAELGVARATYYRWRQLRIGPRSIKLPNGQVRVRRDALDEWLRTLDEGAA